MPVFFVLFCLSRNTCSCPAGVSRMATETVGDKIRTFGVPEYIVNELTNIL